MMGVEYRHFFVVDQENWHPEQDTFERVNKVLGSWGLNDELLEIVDLTSGKQSRTTDASIPKGLAGKVFKFAGPSGGQSLALRVLLSMIARTRSAIFRRSSS